MLKMPALQGNIVPMPVKKAPGREAAAPSRFAAAGPARDTVQFGELAPQAPSILDDPFLINFNVPITPETTAQLNNMLIKVAEKKKELGGSVKLLINTPGGDVYSGLQTVQFIKRLGVPVDGVIMGGQAASMGSLLFLASTGRRIMTADSSLMIHQPRAMELGGTLSELKLIVKDMEGLHRRMQKLIAEKTGIPLTKVEEITNANTDFRVLPLNALKMGFATHVLLDDGRALTKASIEHLSDPEIARRDEDNDYEGLKSEAFNPQIMDPAIEAQLRHQQQMAAPGGGGRRGGVKFQDVLQNLGLLTAAQPTAGTLDDVAVQFKQPEDGAGVRATRPRIYLQA